MIMNRSNPPSPPDPSDWQLDDLEINPDSDRENRRSLSRQEVFVLGWLIFNKTGRTYQDMARDCKLTLAQCRTAVLGLIQEDLLQLR